MRIPRSLLTVAVAIFLPAAALGLVPAGAAYLQTNLISDQPASELIQDPMLVNPWGVALRGSSVFWIANNASGSALLYRGDAAGVAFGPNAIPSLINVEGSPTGVTANATVDFTIGGLPANFLFCTTTGNIIGWTNSTEFSGVAATRPGHVYTGITLGSNSGGNRLYAVDFAAGAIDVFNGSFATTSTTGGFTDPTIPAGYRPFNIQNIGGSLYVMYASTSGGNPQAGPGLGYVRRFNTDGVRDLTFGINNGALNEPWGVVIAPAPFGIFGNTLLIANVGDGTIAAHSPTTGAFLGRLQTGWGVTLAIDGLRALTFGNGSNGGDANTLYFTAGTSAGTHGLFGSLKPTTSSRAMTGTAAALTANVGVATSFTVNAWADADGWGNYSVSINWGDGTSSSAPVTFTDIGTGIITATHIYNNEVVVPANVGVSVTDTDGGVVSVTGTITAATAMMPSGDIVARGDFNGDLKSDVLFRDSAGTLSMWLMNGPAILSGAIVGSPGTTYNVAGIGDFNGDGMADILLRESSGNLAMWLMNSSIITSGAFLGAPGGTYKVAGIADLNGDDKADILLRDAAGNLAVWFMNGPTITSGAVIGSPGGTYTVAGLGDFNGDGRGDILLRDLSGNLAMWLMNGATVSAGALIGSLGSYEVAAVGDFDFDLKGDILLRDGYGQLVMWFMNGTTITSGALIGSPGAAYRVIAAKDYNGDGKADILLRNPKGQFAMWIMNGPVISSGALVGTTPQTTTAH